MAGTGLELIMLMVRRMERGNVEMSQGCGGRWVGETAQQNPRKCSCEEEEPPDGLFLISEKTQIPIPCAAVVAMVSSFYPEIESAGRESSARRI